MISDGGGRRQTIQRLAEIRQSRAKNRWKIGRSAKGKRAEKADGKRVQTERGRLNVEDGTWKMEQGRWNEEDGTRKIKTMTTTTITTTTTTVTTTATATATTTASATAFSEGKATFYSLLCSEEECC